MNKIARWLLSRNKTASILAETRITNFAVVLALFGIVLTLKAFWLANTSGTDENTFWQVLLMVVAFLDFIPIVMEIYDDKD